MKIMKGEVELFISAEKAWKIYRDDVIISKINPQMLSQAKYIQGDGSPGSLRLFKLGPAVESYVKESTQKIEKVENGKSVTYSVIGGELKKMYSSYKVTISFFPVDGKENEQCVAEWKVEFELLTPATPLPEKARDVALDFFKYFGN
ncbi:MLP-like protein 423 [Euphorbia peplus]|nr:MLP-like protein 423 [Euphorbia peplus]